MAFESIQKKILTATSLIFHRIHGASLSPVDGFRQNLAGHDGVTRAGVFQLGKSSLGIAPGAQVDSSVLFVGEVSESVQPYLVGAILSVVFIYELEVISEYLKPLLFFSQSVVGFSVLGHPPLIHAHHLLLASPAAGQVRCGWGDEEEEEKGWYG